MVHFQTLISGGGDGIAWFIDHGTTNLAHGAYANGGKQGFQLSEISVLKGDFIYFIVDPNGTYFYDSTGLDLSITVPFIPFLDLPVSYTNFYQAILGNTDHKSPGSPGRVNTWFDHNLPNYGKDARDNHVAGYITILFSRPC